MDLDLALPPVSSATAAAIYLTVRLKVWEPNYSGKPGRWLDVAVNLIRDHLAIQDYNAILTTLLRQLEGNLPEWVAAAKEDGSLYLFSEKPASAASAPCNIMKGWPGQFWSGGTEGVYLQKLKDHLCDTEYKRDEKGNVTTNLFLAKACRYCLSGASSLFILTTHFGRGYCDLKDCVRQGDKAATAGTLKEPHHPFPI